MRTRHGIKLRNNADEVKFLQSCTGVLPLPKFGLYEYNHPKRGLDPCRFWTLSIPTEMERLVDEQLYDMATKKQALVPFDYSLPDRPPGTKGVVVLFGGDHGDTAFRYHMKVNLSSPAVRKERRELSYQCPTTQLGFVDCV